MKLHLGLLVVLAGLAMGQRGQCPDTTECDLKGGACFPRICPTGLVKIGPCGKENLRRCVCCSKPVEDLVPVRPSEGFSCHNSGVCATRESCHHWQKKDKELNNTRKGSAAYKKLIHEYRSAICNKKEKALCCPEKDKISCILEGQRYFSYLGEVHPTNSLNECTQRCYQDKACNYWSFNFGEGRSKQKECYLFSQIYGPVENARGFSSGLKGCPEPGPIFIDPCLKTNTAFVGNPIDTVPRVNNYVQCSDICKNTNGCSFWSFTKLELTRPGDCFIYSTGSKSRPDPRFISGDSKCPES